MQIKTLYPLSNANVSKNKTRIRTLSKKMNPMHKPKLTRGTKIHTENNYTSEQIKTFQEIWEEADCKMRNSKPQFLFDNEEKDEEKDEDIQESYNWVDERLEKMSSRVEEYDDEEKDTITFHIDAVLYHWSTNNTLDPLEDEDSFYAWIDNRLEKMSLHVEEEDDEEKNNITFL